MIMIMNRKQKKNEKKFQKGQKIDGNETMNLQDKRYV